METSRQLGGNARTIVVYPANVGMLSKAPEKYERGRLPEVFERLWSTNDPLYAVLTSESPSRRAGVVRALADNERVRGIFERADLVETPSDVATICRDLDGCSVGLETRHACKTIANTRLGNAGENAALEMYATRSGLKLRQPIHRFSRICAIEPRRFIVEIAGRIDGIALVGDDPDGSLAEPERVVRERDWFGKKILEVVEVKTRTQRLSKGMSDNERIQLAMYLEIFNADRGVLVEKFGDRLMCHHYCRNRKFYHQVIEGLCRFVRVFSLFLENFSARENYLKLGDAGRIHAICDMISGKKSKWLW